MRKRSKFISVAILVTVAVAILVTFHYWPKESEKIKELRRKMRGADKEQALSEIGTMVNSCDTAVIPLLEEIYKSGDSEEREGIVFDLGFLGEEDEGALSLLSHALLQDPDSEVRWDAYSMICGYWMPHKKAIKALIKATGDEDPVVKGNVIEALGRHRAREALPHLIKILRKRKYKGFGGDVALALGEIGDPRALSTLEEVMRDKEYLSSEEKKDVEDAIKKIKGEIKGSLYFWGPRKVERTPLTQEKIDELRERMKGEDKDEAYVKIGGLTYGGYEEILPLTMEVLKNADKDMRINILRALAYMNTDSALSLICWSLTEDPDRDIRWEAHKFLGLFETNETMVQALVKAIGDEDELIAEEALDTLGRKHAYEAAPLLLEILKARGHKNQAGFIALVLGDIGDESALPVLEEILKDEEYLPPQERKYAIWAIKRLKGEIKEPHYPPPAPYEPKDIVIERTTVKVKGKDMTFDEALPILRKQIKAKDAFTRKKAVRTLFWYGERLKGTEIIEELIDLYEKEEYFNTRCEILRTVAITGDERARPLLEKALNDEHDLVRLAAQDIIQDNEREGQGH